MLRLHRSNTLQSIYDHENPHRRTSVVQILSEARAEPLNDDYEIEDHGNGYASIIPSASCRRPREDA